MSMHLVYTRAEQPDLHTTQHVRAKRMPMQTQEQDVNISKKNGICYIEDQSMETYNEIFIWLGELLITGA